MAEYTFFIDCKNDGVLTISFIQREGIKTFQGSFIFVKTSNEASARRQITKVGERYCLNGIELVKFRSSFIKCIFDYNYKCIRQIERKES